MRATRAKVSQSNTEFLTDQAKHWSETEIANCLKFLTDPDKKKRLTENVECKNCYYFLSSRIGGAAITFRQCGICVKEIDSGSTSIAKICKDCGKRYSLCTWCTGDLMLRIYRKDPMPEIKPDNKKDEL